MPAGGSLVTLSTGSFSEALPQEPDFCFCLLNCVAVSFHYKQRDKQQIKILKLYRRHWLSYLNIIYSSLYLSHILPSLFTTMFKAFYNISHIFCETRTTEISFSWLRIIYYLIIKIWRACNVDHMVSWEQTLEHAWLNPCPSKGYADLQTTDWIYSRPAQYATCAMTQHMTQYFRGSIQGIWHKSAIVVMLHLPVWLRQPFMTCLSYMLILQYQWK